MQRYKDGYTSLLLRWKRVLEKQKKAVGNSWRMDETYIKVKGAWMYLYRAVDKQGKGRLLSDHRLSRNFYKGLKGDNINVMLAAAAMNFKRIMNIWKKMFLALVYRLL